MAQPASEIDLDVNSLLLDVVPKRMKRLDTKIADSIVGGELERTIAGASTLSLTVHDPDRALLQSGMFSYAIDVTLDALRWRLVKVGKSGDDLNLTFEDRIVALLRQHAKPRKATRGNLTRAQFALSLVREVKPPVRFVCPELRKRQPVVGAADRRKLRKALPYQFRRGGTSGEKEDSWTCLQRLAQEVNWRCFASAGAIWFISDTQLLLAPKKTVVTEKTEGVSAIDFDLDSGKRVNEAQVTCRARRWATPPGSLVELQGVGPANGLWLVSDMHRGLYDADAQITLKRASSPLKEPAPEYKTTTSRSKKAGAFTGAKAAGQSSVPNSILRAYAAAKSIDSKHYPYVWGGGHGAAGTPSGGGYDCSGSTCALLAAAGLGFRMGGPAAVSGALAHWGAAGRGTYMTIYANSVHVFVVFHTASGDQHFGTGRWGKSWGGAGFNPQMHPTSGFTARHWPGT